MADRDEGLAKLEGFVAMLAKAAEGVREQTAIVGTRANELEEERSAAETALADLRGEMEDAESEVGGAADEAEEALEELETNAGKLADARLGDIADKIESE